jgi:putative transposase
MMSRRSNYYVTPLQVTIRYDPRDLAGILVYSENGLLCRAVCTELSEKTISLKEVIRARNSRRREVRENLIDLLQVADRHVPPEKAKKEMAMEQTPKTTEYPKFKIKRFACDDD